MRTPFVALALAPLLLAGCKKEPQPLSAAEATKPAAPVEQKLKIALLLPESKTARYESHDRPNFEKKVKALCAQCEVLSSNADQDASRQQSQAEAAITNGATVLVLGPVDSAAAAAIAQRAAQAGVKVISYDRLILDAPIDAYVSFDNEAVGRLQGQALVDKVGKTGSIVVINGAPTDNNARLFKQGAHQILDASGLKIAAEYDTPDWSPDKAQQQMDQAITRVGKGAISGVYAANDGTAGGAIAALKAAGINPLPPVTGQDAELAAVQRIVTGEQFMTVYKAIKAEAEAAAELAVHYARKTEPPAGTFTAKVPNGKSDVPSVLLKPIAVTRENLKSTVIADGFWTVEQVCPGDDKTACKTAQLL
jgi:D-xylose transport system substrate-binding protein